MAWTCLQDGPKSNPKSSPKLDTTWKKEKRPTKNNLAENNPDRAGRDGTLYGASAEGSTRPKQMEKDS